MINEIGNTSKAGVLRNITCCVFALFLICAVIFSIYLLNESINNPHRKEVDSLEKTVHEWETEKLPIFSTLSIELLTKSETVPLAEFSPDDSQHFSEEISSYPSLVYSANVSFFDDFATVQNKTYENFTLSLNGTLLELRDVIVVDKTKYFYSPCVGCWDPYEKSCYLYSTLESICAVVDESDLSFVSWVREGCDSTTMEKLIVQQDNCGPFQVKTATINIRSTNDPYVYLFRHHLEELSASSAQYAAYAIVGLICSGVLLIIPAVFFCRSERPRYFPMQASKINSR